MAKKENRSFVYTPLLKSQVVRSIPMMENQGTELLSRWGRFFELLLGERFFQKWKVDSFPPNVPNVNDHWSQVQWRDSRPIGAVRNLFNSIDWVINLFLSIVIPMSLCFLVWGRGGIVDSQQVFKKLQFIKAKVTHLEEQNKELQMTINRLNRFSFDEVNLIKSTIGFIEADEIIVDIAPRSMN